MKISLPIILVATAATTFVSNSSAQAYCALRDPVSTIYKLYPEADSYRSIVRTINENTRNAVAEELPFTLHFNELGRHTLYVPAKDGKPVGLVHVRSEAGAWGLSEIAWSFDSNLRIHDFSFQRCRSRAKREIDTEKFKSQIRGKAKPELKAMLDEHGQELRSGQLTEFSKEGRELATMLIRSSLKTLEVTRLAWNEDIEILNMLNHAYAAFPQGTTVELFEDIYDPDTIATIERSLGGDNTTNIDRDGTAALRVKNENDEIVGHVIRTPWASAGHKLVLWWNVSENLEILKIIPEGEWPNNEVEQAFLESESTSIDAIAHCQTATQLVGAEVLLVSQTIRHTR